MIPLFNEVLLFTIPCWIINISLNGLYVVGKIFPKFKKFDIPLDAGKVFYDHKRILGNSTTWLGLPVVLIVGSLFAIYADIDLWLGASWGMLVYSGHTIGSFIKRRSDYGDGQFMPFVDHGDYITITGIVMWFLGMFSWEAVILGIVATYIFHPIFTYLAYLAGLHKYPS